MDMNGIYCFEHSWNCQFINKISAVAKISKLKKCQSVKLFNSNKETKEGAQ